jgi:predicted O-methyltransferase YrrM
LFGTGAPGRADRARQHAALRPGAHPTEEDARIVNAFNDRIHNDLRVENVLLPFRDGIVLAYKL